MIEKEFIPYEQALALKELGFNEPYFGYYYTLNGKDWKFAEKSEYYRLDDEINIGWMNIGGKFSLLAPTFSQAFRWFREKYKIRFIIQSSMSDLGEYFKVIFPNGEQRNVSYNTYEEAELACLVKLIDICRKLK